MSQVSSALRLVFGFLMVAVTATLWMVVAIPLLPWRTARIKLCNYYGKSVGRAVVWFAGATPVVQHRERLDASFPAIYVANHTSTLDAFLSIWLCPVGGCGVMKKEIARIPFFGLLYLLSGHLLIDRGDRGKAIAALDGMARLVRAERLGIWIMPEGTRSRNGRLLPLKTGFVHLAIATGLPVVPVVFRGAHRVWERSTFRFVPATVTVEVLEPISTEGWSVETAAQHAAEVHAALARALPEDQQPEVVEATLKAA